MKNAVVTYYEISHNKANKQTDVKTIFYRFGHQNINLTSS